MQLYKPSPKTSKLASGETYLVYDLQEFKTPDLASPNQHYIHILQDLSEQQKLMIPLSGGMDSEALFLSAIQAKIDFTPVIIHFKNDFNLYEIRNAYRLCRLNNKKPLVLNLDLDSFYKSEKHLEYAEKYDCRSPQLATHIWMMEQVEGAFIFPYNPLPILYSRVGQIYVGFPPALYLCYEKYFSENKRSGISFFSMATTDLIYSYLSLPIYLGALFDEGFFQTFTTDNYSFKTEVYRQAGFKTTLNLRKATGFELYRKHLKTENPDIDAGLKNIDVFDHLYRKPMEQIVQDPKYPAMSTLNLEFLYNLYLENPKI